MLSAIDMDHGAIDPGGFVGTKQVNDLGHVFRPGHPAQGASGYGHLDQSLTAGYSFQGWRFRNPRPDQIRSQSIFPKFNSHIGAKAFQGGLGYGNCRIALPIFMRSCAGEP